MSVKVMGIVWEANLPRNQKMVMLSYADHADHNGGNIYPSVGLMAWKTGYSERAIQSITRELEEAGILISTGTGPGGTNRYRINFDALPERAPYGGGEISAPPEKIAPGGEISAPRGEVSAPGGVQKTAEGGEISAPEPSVNHHLEPSVEVDARELVERFEKKTGYAPPHETTTRFQEKWLDPFKRVLEKADGDVDVAWEHINTALDALWAKGYHVSDPSSVYKAALMEIHHGNAEKQPDNDATTIWARDILPYRRGDVAFRDLPEEAQAIIRALGEDNVKAKATDDIRVAFYSHMKAVTQ